MKNVFLAAIALIFSASIANAQTTAQFTSNVENREPVDSIDSIDKNRGDKNITFYSTIVDQEGKTVSHVWKNDNNEVYRRSFNVNAPRWRVWSSVSTYHFNVGDIATVEIQGENGEVLLSKTILIKGSPAAADEVVTKDDVTEDVIEEEVPTEEEINQDIGVVEQQR